jgi:hypothetical protein
LYDPLTKATRYYRFARDLLERANIDPNGGGLRLIAERYLILAERELKRSSFTIVNGGGDEIEHRAAHSQNQTRLEIVGTPQAADDKLRTGS